MAYRTYVGTTGKDSIQILGNNESYCPLFEELERQGIEIDTDGCFKGKIKELQPIVDILEQYILDKKDDIEKIWHKDIFDMTPSKTENMGLTMSMMEKQENAYIFVTANLIKYLEENIDIEYDFDLKKYTFKIKDDKEVYFETY